MNVPTSRAVSCFDLKDSNASRTKHTQGIGCDYFDRFDLYFKNMEPQVTFRMMPHESESFWQWPTGPEDPCMGALARTNAKGASLKAGKQYNAGSIRVVDCAKDVSPQYQLTEWLQV